MLSAERTVRRFVLREIDRLARKAGRTVTFVQIGANDGVSDDPIERFIREKGWSGVLVEPVEASFEALKATHGSNPRLKLVKAAVDERDGTATIYTGSNLRVASLHKSKASSRGRDPVTGHEVTVLSPRTLFEMHGVEEVDLLVIDAEGADGRILRAIDFDSFRASAILFESHVIRAQADPVIEHLRAAGYAVIPMHADTVAVQRDLLTLDDRLAAVLETLVGKTHTLSQERDRALERGGGVLGLPRLVRAVLGARAAPADSNPAPAETGVAPGPSPPTAAPAAPVRKSRARGEPADPFSPRPINAPEVTEPRADRAREDGGPRLRKWYFSINEPGLVNAFEDLAVAVLSAREHTTLQPVCIYVGADHRRLEFLAQNGVTVVRHTLSLADTLQAGYGEDLAPKFSGHWARVDIPDIETKDEFVLYTDIDVMFRRDPATFDFRPPYLAACEEMALGDRHHFNSGVLVLNVPALRGVLPWFRGAVDRRLRGDFRYPPHDQASFNEFFRGVVSWMDPTFNWKPYWGWNDDAAIVHFHGPKPRHVARLRDGLAPRKSFATLHGKSPETYERLAVDYRRYLSQAGLADRGAAA